MYKIFFCDLGKATGIHEIGKRPVVSVWLKDNKCKVYEITSRYKGCYDNYVRMNGYMVRGYCCTNNPFIINKKYLLNYWRDCTKSEVDAINSKISK